MKLSETTKLNTVRFLAMVLLTFGPVWSVAAGKAPAPPQGSMKMVNPAVEFAWEGWIAAPFGVALLLLSVKMKNKQREASFDGGHYH